MSESQLEIDIAEYLILHGDCMKPTMNLVYSIESQMRARYEMMIQVEYEDCAMTIMRQEVAHGLKENYSSVSNVLDKQFVERVLGSDFLKYERVAP